MTIRCAIYTRKSTEEGLEQQFNSLDNQRLAGESYVMSQAGEGWEIVPKHYDDGGYSGGNMNRPGLQELFKDIESGHIDCVVVYKLDRLTRYLPDFAKIIELFDKYSISFVAVTQSFNTSTPMGRRMLTMLLGFSQYERELSGERVRDKIAASKKQGYWMGGYTPLGYDCKDRGLIINVSEAKIITYIYDIFLELKSITKVLQNLKSVGITTKTGRQFSKKTLRQILENPIYKGYVRHKEAEYEGRHKGIIDQKTFEKVRNTFTKLETERPYEKNNALLQDVIICACCNCAMTHTYCYKNKRKYRYYVCSNHIRKKSCKSENKNLPADKIEEFVLKAVKKLLQNPAITALTVHKLDAASISLDVAQDALKNIDKLWNTLHLQEQQRIIKLLIKNVVVDNNGFQILLNPEGIQELIRDIT